MARLIDVDALLEEHCYVCSPRQREMCKVDPVCGSAIWIMEAPTVDAVPVVHGRWISVKERLPHNFVSVLGYMTDAGEFPPVRECYTVGNAFFFPALGDVHHVSHWCEMPQPPKGE